MRRVLILTTIVLVIAAAACDDASESPAALGSARPSPPAEGTRSASPAPSARTVAIPDLSGQTSAEAADSLEALGLVLRTKSKMVGIAHTDGEVLSQSVKVGKQVAPGTVVTITVAEVKATVPDLTGMTKNQAIDALNEAGLKAKSKVKESTKASDGHVFSQSIASRKRVDPKTVVTFTIAKAPPPPAGGGGGGGGGTNCDPAYPGVCLHDGIGDYDCADGEGNGPNYVSGPVRVLPPDPFGLDADRDGWGCE